ncbi:hypothetical protein [uncultured Jannaschia sp.]|uniref:hypothetical protein n=1 Tax=uncultured Jannaschia sp. TaxID=293347 RepID=UPI0026368A17|nr:hypothetical protein [uncultured Jannaschia sp.]
MIRPEAAAAFARWRETLAGAAALALGLWLWLTNFGLLALFGGVLVAVGAILVLSGIRRARFWSAGAAPGLVEVDEGRITYLGPMLGGSVDLDALSAVTFRRTATGEAFWRLEQEDGPTLVIPEGAANAEVLLDALAPLPGFDTGAMIRAVRGRGANTTKVWQRNAPRALTWTGPGSR